jgi:hypothetical protein
MAVILPSAMPTPTPTATAAVAATATMPATAAVAATAAMPATAAVAPTFVPAVLAMASMPVISVPPSPSVLPFARSAITIGVPQPPMRRPTVVWAPVPKSIRPHGPIIPVLQALVLTHRVQIGLLHVIDDLIGYALIAELCQLRWRQAIDGL